MTEDDKIKDLLAEKRHEEMMAALNKLILLQNQLIEFLLNTTKKK